MHNIEIGGNVVEFFSQSLIRCFHLFYLDLQLSVGLCQLKRQNPHSQRCYSHEYQHDDHDDRKDELMREYKNP